MVAGERHHQAGREGVLGVKRWLESTTRFQVPWDVYGSWQQTTVKLLSGEAVSFDIAGHLLDEDGHAGVRFYGEVKNYTSASGQQPAYEEYLAVCYSATCQSTTVELDP